MYNCIFNGHCTKAICDQSCPNLVETSYLLERNGISMNSNVFHANKTDIDKYNKIIDGCEGRIRTVITTNTNSTAELLTYCGICKHWDGSRLHATVYNLKLSQYIETLQKSWSNKTVSDNAENMNIWATSAKILIISNMDYVTFKDFQCQTLLSLIQNREKPELGTIIVSPQISSLVGDGQFFTILKDRIKRATV